MKLSLEDILEIIRTINAGKMRSDGSGEEEICAGCTNTTKKYFLVGKYSARVHFCGECVLAIKELLGELL